MEDRIRLDYLFFENGMFFTTPKFNEAFGDIADVHERTQNQGAFIRKGYLLVPRALEIAKYLGLDSDFEPEEVSIEERQGRKILSLKGEKELEKRLSEEEFEHFWQDTIGRRIAKKRMAFNYFHNELIIDDYTNRSLIVGKIQVPKRSAKKLRGLLGKDITDNLSYRDRRLAK